jgi:hypothetical protein
MELDLLAQLSSFGIGAVVAGIVLMWKRADDQRFAGTQTRFITESERRFDQMLQAFKENTDALKSLQTTLGRLEAIDHVATRLERRIDALGEADAHISQSSK